MWFVEAQKATIQSAGRVGTNDGSKKVDFHSKMGQNMVHADGRTGSSTIICCWLVLDRERNATRAWPPNAPPKAPRLLQLYLDPVVNAFTWRHEMAPGIMAYIFTHDNRVLLSPIVP